MICAANTAEAVKLKRWPAVSAIPQENQTARFANSRGREGRQILRDAEIQSPIVVDKECLWLFDTTTRAPCRSCAFSPFCGVLRLPKTCATFTVGSKRMGIDGCRTTLTVKQTSFDLTVRCSK